MQVYVVTTPINAHLSSFLGLGQFLFKADEDTGKDQHHQAVTDVSKHDSKQEWERDDGIGSCGCMQVCGCVCVWV